MQKIKRIKAVLLLEAYKPTEQNIKLIKSIIRIFVPEKKVKTRNKIAKPYSSPDDSAPSHGF